MSAESLGQRYFEIEGDNFVDNGSIQYAKERAFPTTPQSVVASEITKSYGPVLRKRASFGGGDLEQLYKRMRLQTFAFFRDLFASDQEKRYFLYLTSKHEIFFYSACKIESLPISKIDSSHWDLLALLSDKAKHGALRVDAWVGEQTLGTVIFINEAILPIEALKGKSLRREIKETVTHELVHVVEWAIMAASDSKAKPLDERYIEGCALMIVEGKTLK